MYNRQAILIIEVCCILVAIWPYVCLTYLSELKQIKNELRGIKNELRELKKEEIIDERIRTGDRLD